MSPPTYFLSGLIVMGFTVAGMFFLRFWSRTRDPLFAIFAFAFWLLAVNQALIAGAGKVREEQSWIYLVRLVAFVLIIAAVLAKNLARPKVRPRYRHVAYPAARPRAGWRGGR